MNLYKAVACHASAHSAMVQFGSGEVSAMFFGSISVYRIRMMSSPGVFPYKFPP